jgi:hypothetical protein
MGHVRQKEHGDKKKQKAETSCCVRAAGHLRFGLHNKAPQAQQKQGIKQVTLLL